MVFIDSTTLQRIFIIWVISLSFFGCRHYHRVRSFPAVAVVKITNKTNEPFLDLYLRNALTEEAMKSGTLVSSADADAIYRVEATIDSYTINPIGLERIISRDEDQRQYRTSVFEIQVKVTYHIVKNQSPYHTWDQQEIGTAQFSELVDMDIVKSDGFRRALHDVAKMFFLSIPPVSLIP